MRPYVDGDFDACLAVFDTNVPGFFRPHERAEFVAFLADLPGPYLVLEDPSGDVLGCAGYARGRDPAVADLCWGMIRHDAHRRGHGRTLTTLRVARDP